MLVCLGSRCWIKTNAKPLLFGRLFRISRNASSPPAEAPNPTTGQSGFTGVCTGCSDGSLTGFSSLACFGFCFLMDFTVSFFYGTRRLRKIRAEASKRGNTAGVCFSERFQYALAVSHCQTSTYNFWPSRRRARAFANGNTEEHVMNGTFWNRILWGLGVGSKLPWLAPAADYVCYAEALIEPTADPTAPASVPSSATARPRTGGRSAARVWQFAPRCRWRRQSPQSSCQ